MSDGQNDTKTESGHTGEPTTDTARVDSTNLPQGDGSAPAQPTEGAAALLQKQNEALTEHTRVLEGQLSDIKDQVAEMAAAHEDLAKRVEDIERRKESTAERPSQEPLEDARLPLETRVARLEGKLKHL